MVSVHLRLNFAMHVYVCDRASVKGPSDKEHNNIVTSLSFNPTSPRASG